MSCRCGRHNNDTENAPLAQLVEHLTLNQGVQELRGRFFFCPRKLTRHPDLLLMVSSSHAGRISDPADTPEHRAASFVQPWRHRFSLQHNHNAPGTHVKIPGYRRRSGRR